MQTFKEQVNESTQMRIVDLLPKKVKRMLYRYKNQDKYKGAILMMKHLTKDPDVISRGLSKARIQSIAADHFGLNHREFAKILNRKTRYEEAPPGMKDTVKKFKAKGMDDDEAFALAWSIYNKKEDEIENINEGTTTASTLFELVIIACINAPTNRKRFDAYMARDRGYQGWLASANKDRKWNTDPDQLFKFATLLKRSTRGKSATSAGQTSPKTSAMWKEVTGKGSDTSKADVNIDKHRVSVKGPAARLMSGVKEESLATLYAAFDTLGVNDLGLELEKIVNNFVSQVKTVGADMNTRTIKEQDPKTLSAENKKAFKDLEKQVQVKVQAEAAFKKAFTNKQFADAFAWEAMSGEKKFDRKEGFSDAMLVWNYDLDGVVWHPNLSLNNKYTKKVSSQMKFSANVKSGSYKKAGTKYGYSISQTVGLAMKTAEEEFDIAKNESIDQRINLENMLTEGRIDEAKLLDMLKGVWERLKNAIRTAWAKLINVISNLVQQIQEAIDGGIDKMLNAFELEPVIRFNNNIRL